MLYIQSVVNSIFLTASGAGEEAVGGSILPFLGFMLFLFGSMMIFIGIVMVISAKREWKIYYAPHDEYTEDLIKQRKRDFLKGRIVYILGIVFFILSFVLL